MIALAVFALFRAPLATAVVFVAGNLLLPEMVAVNPPLLPDIGKQEVISVSALIAAIFFARQRLGDARIGTGLEVLAGIGVAGVVFTVANNTDFMRYGPEFVPGTNPTDVIPDGIQVLLRWGIPFIIGRAMFTRARDGRVLMYVLVASAVIYSIPIIVELLISPQLHRFVYGYYQHSFLQTKRGDGYRPMVFMAHGLHLTLYLVMCLGAAGALWRIERKALRASLAPAAVYLGVLLIVCRSTGSTMYGLFLAPLVLLASPRLQIRIASLLAIFVIAYPILRNFDVIPFDFAVDMAKEYAGEKRAKSLSARLYTEETMLERIKERPWFGWASPGRSGVRDPDTGRMATVYDGYWIIILSKRGIVGYITTFALLIFPIIMAGRALPRIRAPEDRVMLGALSLMIAITTFDLLPNSTIDNYMTLFSGALAGLVPGILREQRAMQATRRNGKSPLPLDKQTRMATLLGPK